MTYTPRVPYFYWHYYYLSATSLVQGEIIGLLVIHYEMFGDINTNDWYWIEFWALDRNNWNI